MALSAGQSGYLAFLRDIAAVSTACGTVTYIWGGFTPDIVAGHFLREHRDLDGFVRDMLDVLPELMAAYDRRGYDVSFRDDIDMLVIRKGDLHAAFNRLEIDGETAMWRHVGEEGTVYFPVSWLDAAPRDFYDVPTYTAGLQLDYALKSNIRLTHATWELREKDRVALAQLESALVAHGLDPEVFLRQIWSYTPFWVKHGYPAYAMPVVARPLYPPEPPNRQRRVRAA